MSPVYRLKKIQSLLKGSSFASVVEVTDESGQNFRQVMKMKGAGNGEESLVSEYIVNRLCAAVGLPVPDASVIEIPEKFPWEIGTDEFDDILQKSFGMNLGMELIPNHQPVSLEEIQSQPQLLSVLGTVDALFWNCDRLLASGNLLRDVSGKIWLVDHGSCRFFAIPDVGLGAGVAASEEVRILPRGHCLLGMKWALQRELLQKFTDEAIVGVVREVPQAWIVGMGETASGLSEKIISRRKQLLGI